MGEIEELIRYSR